MAKLADRVFYHLRNAASVGNIDCNGSSFSTRVSDFARGDLRGFEIDVRHGDIGAFACKSHTGSVSDSARTARDERAFTVESHVQHLQGVVSIIEVTTPR